MSPNWHISPNWHFPELALFEIFLCHWEFESPNCRYTDVDISHHFWLTLLKTFFSEFKALSIELLSIKTWTTDCLSFERLILGESLMQAIGFHFGEKSSKSDFWAELSFFIFWSESGLKLEYPPTRYKKLGQARELPSLFVIMKISTFLTLAFSTEAKKSKKNKNGEKGL